MRDSSTRARGAQTRNRAVLAILVGTLVAGTSYTPARPAGDAPAGERQERSDADRIAELERLIEQLKDANEEQVRELKRRIAALEARLEQARSSGASKKEAGEAADDDLAAIRAEAEQLTAGEARREEQTAAKRKSFTGGQRTLQSLNPEISFLGDVSWDWTSGRVKDGFRLRGVELGLQSPLDPYSRFKAFLGGHSDPFGPELGTADEEETEAQDHGGEINLAIGELYAEWVALPTHMRLYVGKFRQQYGTLNRWHLHALPSVDAPFALKNAFGEHELIGLGVGAHWQLPSLWATSNGLTVEIVNADNATAFAGADWRDPSVLIRHTGFFELGPDAYLDIGLNATRGANDGSGDRRTTVEGIDVNYVWEPVNRAHYRMVEFRGEWLHSAFEREAASTIRADSYYAYLSYRLGQRFFVGLRWDDAELPSDRFALYDPGTLEPMEFRDGLRERAWTPYLTWWQSEFVRLRLQYQHAWRDFAASWGGDDENKVWVQVTFAAGPHKHESY